MYHQSMCVGWGDSASGYSFPPYSSSYLSLPSSTMVPEPWQVCSMVSLVFYCKIFLHVKLSSEVLSSAFVEITFRGNVSFVYIWSVLFVKFVLWDLLQLQSTLKWTCILDGISFFQGPFWGEYWRSVAISHLNINSQRRVERPFRSFKNLV